MRFEITNADLEATEPSFVMLAYTSYMLKVAHQGSLAEGKNERELARFEEHFLITSRMEYQFWEMAYREELWP